jgi:class 3 adenylate cyclase
MQRAVSPDGSSHTAGRELPVRIGIHAGEPIRVEQDYLGMPVNVAARMCKAAAGGQILVSDVVRGLVGSRGGFALRDLGEQVLSGIRSPIRVWELGWKAPGATDSAPALADPALTSSGATEREPDTLVILFADIVDSIPHTERLGDAGFRQRARELDVLLRAHIREHRGTVVDGKLVGDGVLATFPSARGAIMCALRCGALSASVELELHLGLHAGDVLRDGNNIYGGAVNIASRISAATKPGEILVSDTIRGLARTSAAVAFEERGEYVLKGIDEPMRLFTVIA